jgi:hypothetical protein
MSTDLRVIQTESVLAISVCKIPIRKDNSQGDRKEHKERMNTDPRVTESVLAIFAISVCKNPIRKTIHTEIAKNTKDEYGSKGHRIRLSGLCDLCV